VHVTAFTVLNDDVGRTSFQATNQATTEIDFILQPGCVQRRRRADLTDAVR
jgi:hypothetical protein